MAQTGLRRLARSARAAIIDFKRPPYAPAGHFLSPRTNSIDVSRALQRPPAVCVDVRADAQLDLLESLDISPIRDNRYSNGPENTMFSKADAALLRAMLLRFQPARVVEVGSGFSTAVMLDVADVELPNLKITCIEPYAQRLRSRLRPGDLDQVVIHEELVQDVPAKAIVADLVANDILFIDSSHVCKAGSDVSFLLFDVLPLVAPDVIVHVHDIFWPFEYPADWLREGRDWNEAYILHAYLAGNPGWQIELFGDWILQNHPGRFPEEVRDSGSGSIWLRKL